MIVDRLQSVVSDLNAISGDARISFGDLTAEELNWKRSEKSWSVAQCLDHLITINSLYFPLFEKMRTSDIASTFLEKHSPLSGFFGRYLVNSMRPENPKKMKTSKKACPSASEIDSGIVLRFEDHQRELGDHIIKISPEIELSRIITSPLAGFVTYSLDDCLTMLVVHEQRHMQQAKRVMSDLGIGNADFGSL
jgi:DinB family.